MRTVTGGIVLLSLMPVMLAAQGPGISDSGGVAIVRHESSALPSHFVLAGPTVEIGTTSGAELVNVVAAIRMPNGRIVVGDSRRRELLRFGAKGALERVLGRDGHGPGEFAGFSWMRRHGRDSIATYDGRQFRYSVFTDSGFVRQLVLQRSEHMFRPEMMLIGIDADGSPVVTKGGAIQLADSGPARITREAFPVVRYARDGSPGRLIGRFPGHELEVSVIREGPATGGFVKGPRLFGTGAAFAVVNGHLIVVDNESFQFDVVDTTGRLVRRVRRASSPRPVTFSHKAQWIEAQMEAIRDSARREMLRRDYEASSHAPVFPALEARLVIDARQRVWLAEYVRPGDREQHWWIFTLDGRMVGHLAVPASLTVTDAGTDYVLGVWRDEDGVQTVRLYRLARG